MGETQGPVIICISSLPTIAAMGSFGLELMLDLQYVSG